MTSTSLARGCPSLLSDCSADTDSQFAFDPGMDICSHVQKRHMQILKDLIHID